MSLMTNIVTRYYHFRRVFYMALAGSVFIPVAQACYSDCAINVYFDGVYNDETCEVVINNAGMNEVVTLPRIPVASLKDNASEAGSVPFDITLKDCPPERTVTVFFNSSATAADSETGNLVNLTGALYSSNVQIRLRKENSSQVFIDDPASGQDYIISTAADPVSHIFTASYYAKGDAAVTAGQVHAIAGVELVYN